MSRFRNILQTLSYTQPTYTEVEYATFDGSTYLNLGYQANVNTKVFTKFYNTKSGGCEILGDINNPYFYIASSSSNYLAYGFSSIDTTTTTAMALNAWHTVKMDKTGIVLDWNSVATFSSPASFTSQNLYLGAVNTSGTPTPLAGRVSIVTIYENDILIHNYVPAKDDNGTVCFYDKVTQRAIYPTTGTLSGGREIHRVDYLRNTGSSYIKTGILTWDNSLEEEIKCTVEQQSSGTHSWWGAYNTWSSSGRQCPNIPTWSNLKPTTSFKAGTSSTSGTADIGIDYGQTGVFSLKGDTISWSAGTSATFDRLTSTPFSITQEIALFCQHRGSTYDQWATSSFYYAKFWLNNELIRNFQPAYDENDVGFMLDEVEHVIYDNAGSGSFSYGND